MIEPPEACYLCKQPNETVKVSITAVDANLSSPIDSRVKPSQL